MKFRRIIVLAAVCGFFAGGCAHPPEFAVLEQVFPHIDEACKTGEFTFDAFAFGEGDMLPIQFRGEPEMFYWVQYNQAYTLNDAAGECSPYLPPAPPEVQEAFAVYERARAPGAESGVD